MYINRVILKNVKGFVDLDLRFDRRGADGSPCYAGWNVITGDNASGKTTVLKAIAMALLGPDTTRALQPSLSGWIRGGSESGTVAVQIEGAEEDRFTTGRPSVAPFYAELVFEKRGGEIIAVPGNEYVKRKKSAINGPWAVAQGAWFAVAYGPFRRLYGTSTDAMKLMSAPGRPPRFATLFKEDATLEEGQSWLRELQFKSLELREREKQLLSAVLDLLDANFLRHGLRVGRVDSEGLWLKSEDGMVLPLGDMGDGYRSSLALLIDILRHLSEVFPNQPLVIREGDAVFVPHRGVVLIDEVDAHLHPEWQRQIGFWLKSHFPNIQFIVTTHSAFVCQAADDFGIYSLSQPGDNEQPVRLEAATWKEIVAGTVDEILRSDAFKLTHTRSPRAVDARKEWSSLRAKLMRTQLNTSEIKRMQQLELFVKSPAEAD